MVCFKDALLIKKKKKAMGDFVSPLDGAVPPTAAGRDLRQSGGCLFGGSSWPSAAKARVQAALPGPDGDGEIWLCRLNQSRTGNGQELTFQKATWCKR